MRIGVKPGKCASEALITFLGFGGVSMQDRRGPVDIRADFAFGLEGLEVYGDEGCKLLQMLDKRFADVRV